MKKYRVIIMALIISGFLTGCIFGEKGKNGKGIFGKKNNTAITSISYHYDGTIGADNYNITIYKNSENKTILKYDAMDKPYGEIQMEIDGNILESLKQLYVDNKVYRWDGFSKFNANISDGSGFSLNISFEDGKSMRASGTNSYPNNYRQFMEGFREIVNPLIDKLIDKAKAEKIASGINGNLTYIFFHINQSGNVGKNNITFSIDQDNDKVAFYLDCDLKDDAYLPIGKYYLRTSIKEQSSLFEKIQQLVNKYELINWYDYSQNSEDNVNHEWFQLTLYFDSNERIDARGSKAPENYNEFKSELLELLFATYKQIQE